MIRAVVFDMFETLVTLFEGRTYFGEDIAADVGADPEAFRKEWHAIEHDRSIGTYTIEEGLAVVFKKLGIYSEEHVKKAASGRWEALGDTFSAIPQESLDLLKGLKEKGFPDELAHSMGTFVGEELENWLWDEFYKSRSVDK